MCTGINVREMYDAVLQSYSKQNMSIHFLISIQTTQLFWVPPPAHPSELIHLLEEG